MNPEFNESVHLLPPGRTGSGEYLPPTEDRLLEMYRLRQGARHDEFAVEPPAVLPPDGTSWFGKPRYSPAVRQRNEQIHAIRTTEELTEYAVLLGLRLEYVIVRETERTIRAALDVYRSAQADPFEAAIMQEVILDGRDNIRELTRRASEKYRRETLG